MCKNSGPCLQFLITISSFIATATIAQYLDEIIIRVFIIQGSYPDPSSKLIGMAKGGVIIFVSIFALILSFIKAYSRYKAVRKQVRHANEQKQRKASYEMIQRIHGRASIISSPESETSSRSFDFNLAQDGVKTHGEYINAYKAVVVQIVDSTFDMIVAISFYTSLEYGENQSFLLIIASLIGFGEEFIELISEITLCFCEYCMDQCWNGFIFLVFIEFIGCIVELSFGIYLAIKVLNQKSGLIFFICIVGVLSVLIGVIICVCRHISVTVSKQAVNKRTRMRKAKESLDEVYSPRQGNRVSNVHVVQYTI